MFMFNFFFKEKMLKNEKRKQLYREESCVGIGIKNDG